MRGVASLLAFTLAICGLLVVIAFTASEAYLNLRDTETNLNNALLLGSLGPEGWAAEPLARTTASEQFISSCLAVPLLDGTSIAGRGAVRFTPAGASAAGVQLLMVETSARGARGVMDSVHRDTENDCRRGVTVGTVASAEVTSLDTIGADDAILVEFTRNIAGEMVTFSDAIVRNGNYITRISYRHDPATQLSAADISALAGSVVARIENPPSEAELEAAGAAEQPSTLERASDRIQAGLGSRLTFEERVSPYVGVGVAGGLGILFYLLGAKLSARRTVKPDEVVIAPSAPPTRPTLDNYSSSQRRWIQQRGQPTNASAALEDYDDVELDDDGSAPAAAELPPVIDFPQRSIDEKLKILKEARMREPLPEPVTPSAYVPTVDWTAEISKPDAAPQQPPAPEPVTRKVLLQKLRSQQSDSN